MVSDETPPWPSDVWDRRLRPTGLAHGPMWVSAADIADHDPCTETLGELRAAQILESWLSEPGERAFVHKLHGRLCGLPAHLDPEPCWEQVTREYAPRRLFYVTKPGTAGGGHPFVNDELLGAGLLRLRPRFRRP